MLLIKLVDKSFSTLNVSVTLSPAYDTTFEVAAVIGSDVVKVIVALLKIGNVLHSSIETAMIEGGR